MINPEVGFTSDIIKDVNRVVGRTDSVRDCVKALNAPLGLLAIYGKRGVGKSSLLRQVQNLALGDYTLVKKAGIFHELPARPRKYVTVFYTCDSMIKNGADLLTRLCNDQDEQDGLRGSKGIDSSKYARTVPGDIVQTFRNYVQSIVTHAVKRQMGRDGLLILLDEFDVISDKSGLGSLIKTLTSENVKFGVCGIGRDLSDLVADHNSVERLLEEGAIHVRSMPDAEIFDIFTTAEYLFKGKVKFDSDVIGEIASMSGGYPYLAQLIGKECVNVLNRQGGERIDRHVLAEVKTDIRDATNYDSYSGYFVLNLKTESCAALVLTIPVGSVQR